MNRLDVIWPSRYLARLNRDIDYCLGVIEDRVEKHPVQAKIGGREVTAWGQFLDDSRPQQHGLYGTTAAIELLGLRGRVSATCREQGLQCLLTTHRLRTSDVFYKGEFSLVIKSCCLVDALTAHDAKDNIELGKIWSEREDFICRARLTDGPNTGAWGFYYLDNSSRDPEGQVIPTGLVLLTFNLKGQIGRLGNWENTAQWLEKRLRDPISLHPSELALALRAVRKLQEFYPADVKVADSFLIRTALKNSLAWLEHFQQYISERPDSPETRYHEEFFPLQSEFEILDYICDYHHFTLFHPQILGQIERILENIRVNQGYRSSDSNRIATRANLRAFKSLLAVQSILKHNSWLVLSLFIYANQLRNLVHLETIARVLLAAIATPLILVTLHFLIGLPFTSETIFAIFINIIASFLWDIVKGVSRSAYDT